MPKVWDEAKSQPTPLVGDRKGTRFVWDDAGNTLGYTGETWCGSVEAWQRAGEPGYLAPLMQTDAQGKLPCCILAELIGIGGVGIGGDSLWPVEIAGKLVGGGFTTAVVSSGVYYQGVLAGSGSTRSMNTYRPMYDGVLVGSGNTLSASTWSANYQGSISGGGLSSAGLTWGIIYQGSTVGGGETTGDEVLTPVYRGVLTGSGHVLSEVNEDVPFIGEIRWIAAAVTPSGWIIAQGDLLSRSTYAALFAVIGTTWGVGDGSTTFGTPNLQRRSIIGEGGSATFGPSTAIGSIGGEEGHLLTGMESGVPAHTHPPSSPTKSIAEFGPTGGFWTGPAGTNGYQTSATGANTAANAAAYHNTYHPVAVMRPIMYTGV